MVRSFALLLSCLILITTAKGAEPQVAPSRPHQNALATNPDRWPGKIDVKKLRQLVEGGSSDWMNSRPQTQDELLRELPPKYRQLVKEYFEKLEKTQKENDKK